MPTFRKVGGRSFVLRLLNRDMLTSTSSLLLAVLGLYLLVQSVGNYSAFSRSCDSATVASLFNFVNGFAGIACLLYFGWAASRGGPFLASA